MTAPRTSEPRPQTVYLDLTHLGRHVTGLERIAIELFEKAHFEGASMVPVRARGLLSMIFKQQILLPLLALLHPSSKFVFPGFPPSPLFLLARRRTYLYVHDLFLVTRRADLSRKAKIYMAWPFRVAVSKLKNFLVNSEKTRQELLPFIGRDASIALYRPAVGNVFNLSATRDPARGDDIARLRVVSVGTVEPRKNYMACAKIVTELAKLYDGGAELHIVGRSGWGPDAERLADLPNVIVHGFLTAEAAKRVIEDADVYLCTSHDEGLGLPLLEVQYAGLPVVAPGQTVFREVLGSSACFIDSANAFDAAQRIHAVLSATGWRQREATAAVANVARWNALAGDDGQRIRPLFAAGSDETTNIAIDGELPAPKLRHD